MGYLYRNIQNINYLTTDKSVNSINAIYVAACNNTFQIGFTFHLTILGIQE